MLMNRSENEFRIQRHILESLFSGEKSVTWAVKFETPHGLTNHWQLCPPEMGEFPSNSHGSCWDTRDRRDQLSHCHSLSPWKVCCAFDWQTIGWRCRNSDKWTRRNYLGCARCYSILVHTGLLTAHTPTTIECLPSSRNLIQLEKSASLVNPSPSPFNKWPEAQTSSRFLVFLRPSVIQGQLNWLGIAKWHSMNCSSAWTQNMTEYDCYSTIQLMIANNIWFDYPDSCRLSYGLPETFTERD
jgi:hypothetical protein